ncbi:MAG: ceramidase domain-containing protein [Pseudomonadota bacterium]
MELTEFIDGYCERTDFTYWSEPVNAITNAAFIVAALIMWRRTAGMPLGRALCAVLAAIGLGSYLFHTHAQVWSAIADTTPIAAFILLYIYAANRQFWGLGLWPGLALTALFIPYVFVTYPIFNNLPFFEVSSGYWPVPLLIAIYAVLLRKREPAVARGLAIGAGILVASLFFRTIDMPVCGSLPLGTHFLWHILNGIMLGWMIEVYRRHRLTQMSSSEPA